MIRLRVLGALDLRDANDAAIEAVLAQPKRMALLAYLALATPRGFQRRDILVAVLWPELSQARARNALSQSLHHLRRALGTKSLITRGDEEVALSDTTVWCDAREFDACLEGDELQRAVTLYRGDLMAGFFLSGTVEFERWLDGQRTRYNSRAGAAGWVLAEAAASRGDGDEASRWGRWAAGLTPDDESALRRLIALLDRLGDRVGALHVYDEFARRVATEYQSEPAAETQQSIQSVRERTTAHWRPVDPVVSGPNAESTQRIDAPAVGAPKSVRRGRSRNWRLIAALVAAGVLVSLVTYRMLQSRPGVDDISASIAVLPFLDLSEKHDDEYLSDGLAEDLSDALSRIKQLRVTSRTSAFAFKGASTDARVIGRQLGVGTLLEGSVRREGAMIRVTAQLIDAVTGYHLWSRTYDRQFADVFTVEDEITRAIVDELRVELDGKGTSPRASLATHATPSLEAYSLYLEGRYFWNQRTATALAKAASRFQAAIAADSNYASAYAGLADTYNVMAGQTYESPAIAFPKAKAAALHAIALDNMLAEAHSALGFIHLFGEWNGPAARRELQTALDLDPSYATARLYHAFYLVSTGRPDDAVAEVQRAQKNDPLSLIINARVGFMLVMDRRFADAIDAERRTLDLDSTYAPAYWSLGDAYAGERKFDRALAEFDKARAHSGLLLGDAGFAYAASGNRRAAREYLAQMDTLARNGYVDPYDRALVYARLDEPDSAMRWLEVGRPEHSASVVWLRSEPMFDRLRSDKRFAMVVREVGL